MIGWKFYFAWLLLFLGLSGCASKPYSFHSYAQQNSSEGLLQVSEEQSADFLVFIPYQGEQVVQIEANRVRSVHLLFAGNGSSIASRFGHTMLRLVVCPAQESTDEECDQNLSEHLILGYRAHVDELTINNYKALTGRYNAYLYAQRFVDIYQEYAITEFRDLYSVPIHLQQNQIENLLGSLAKIHWQFEGEYRFLSENCATLLASSIAAILPSLAEEPAIQARYVRPNKLYQELLKSPLLDSASVEDLDLAEERGFYFPSTKPYYEKALKVLAGSCPNYQSLDLQTYLRVDPLERRSLLLKNKHCQEIFIGNDYIYEAQLILEELALLRSGRIATALFTRYIESNAPAMLESKDVFNQRELDLIKRCLFSPINQALQPMKRFKGVPSQEELAEIDAGTGNCTDASERATALVIFEKIGLNANAQWLKVLSAYDRWNNTAENIDWLYNLK